MISTLSLGIWKGLPRYFAIGGVLGALTISPTTWWLYKRSKLNGGARPSNIFYEDSCTKDDIDRIRHIDMIESLGHQMKA